jgi:uncharacterized Zn finger protein (UPF0148 family)
MSEPKEKPVGCRCKKCGYFGPQFPSQITPLTQCPACGHRGFSEEVGVVERQEREITDLRSRLADAQARAERAEDVAAKAVAMQMHAEKDSPSWPECLDEARKAVSANLTPATQGRTDGERLDWLSAYSRVVKADSSRTVVQIQLPVARSFRAAINLAMDATAPEVKGGAA